MWLVSAGGGMVLDVLWCIGGGLFSRVLCWCVRVSGVLLVRVVSLRKMIGVLGELFDGWIVDS